MFGNLVQKLQTLSPISSPVQSPVSSPKARRKFGGPRWRRQQAREEFREVQSEPEYDETPPSSKARKDKSKKRSNHISIGPPTLVSSSRDISHYTLHAHQNGNQPPVVVYGSPYGVTPPRQQHPQPLGLPKVQQQQQNIYQAVRVHPVQQRAPPKHLPQQPQLQHKPQPPPQQQQKQKQNAPGFAPLHGSKSLGRLDGMKEVRDFFDRLNLFCAPIYPNFGLSEIDSNLLE
ncbi:Hypothetical predicted protein [Cloeon dipterum]|uniref:Uncharacterized protein n=1 Tax=Cloeon dipterum TaxID=197152 RepID=A0A8S1C1H1_9INSE|nr:Hypothetical predicted protein [Cloeon dipterum]